MTCHVTVFENWESEFLQMGGYVLLTAYLVQKSSAESKPEDQPDRPDDEPRRAPGPCRAGPDHRQAATGSRLAKHTLYGLPTYSP
ncbi:DUF6766 family protein [Micromonospora siamensis]|uniref:DUF6766 family protein n=1 Tax=Micromonospora siamensis TaxID=299152 RepID=UPI002F91996C